MRVSYESDGIRLSTRKQRSVDVHTVPEVHREIDRRLINWARTIKDPVTSRMSPMWQHMPRVLKAEAGTPVSVDADYIDADRIAKGVAALPEKHRHVLAWHYVSPTSPKLAAGRIGVAVQELPRLVAAARQMLINKGV